MSLLNISTVHSRNSNTLNSLSLQRKPAGLMCKVYILSNVCLLFKKFFFFYEIREREQEILILSGTHDIGDQAESWEC